MARQYGFPSPGNLRTPLEGVDLAADMLNRAATLPGAVVSSVLDAAGNAVHNLKSAIATPREQPERPIPPDQLISPIPKAIIAAVSGGIETVKSGVGAVVQNVEGAKQELEDFIRG